MKKKSSDDTERQIRLIHNLARRLPWMVVIITLFAMTIFLIQAYFGWL